LRLSTRCSFALVNVTALYL